MNIFIAKLSYNTNEDTVHSLFEQYGEVESVKIIYDKIENRSKGYGFVEMPNDDEALNAIEALNESELDGRTIVVKKSTPKKDNSRGGGGFNRNRY